jgi:hypothetical protein
MGCLSMRSPLKRKKVIAALGAVGAVAITAIAVAYWTGGGTGSGTAEVGTSGAVVLTGTVAPGISPGTEEPVSFTAANGSGSSIQVTKIHLVGIAVGGANAACETADFTMADVTEGHLVPAGATADALPNEGSLVYVNTGVSQDACKGATLTLTLSSS